MPTVLRQNGFSFMIYLNDHDPSHVHIFGQGELIVFLGDAETRVSVRQNIRMSSQDERRALEIAGEKQPFLLDRWNEING